MKTMKAKLVHSSYSKFIKRLVIQMNHASSFEGTAVSHTYGPISGPIPVEANVVSMLYYEPSPKTSLHMRISAEKHCCHGPWHGSYVKIIATERSNRPGLEATNERRGLEATFALAPGTSPCPSNADQNTFNIHPLQSSSIF